MQDLRSWLSAWIRRYALDSELDRERAFALMVYIVGCFINALATAGSFRPFVDVSYTTGAAVAVVAGIVAGAGHCPRSWLIGSISGAIVGVGVFLGVFHYVRSRDTIFVLEVGLVQMACALPGIAVGVGLYRLRYIAEQKGLLRGVQTPEQKENDCEP